MKYLSLLLVLIVMPVHASDLDTIGPTYPIGEPHLLDDLQQRLRRLDASGELDRRIAQGRQRSEAAVQHPTPVAGLVSTRARRTFFFDPSFTLDRNVLDAQGHLLFAAGLRKNPLDVVSLSSHLLFFDARDPRQRDQARQLIVHYRGRIKLILVGGSYLELMQTWQRPVYFDQQGRLTRRFGITQVPALVSQEGARLRIDELEIPR